MISFIRGKILETEDGTITVDVNGVGYELQCSANSLDDFSMQDPVQAFVYTNVREDAIQLYGFSTKTEKQMFLSLIKVNGIGPKMATQILSGAGIEQICTWVEEGDVKALTSLPKVGKKTAEQMILTLKGHLVFENSSPNMNRKLGPKAEITSALVNLGFKLQSVELIVQDLGEDISIEDGIRRGLSALTNN